MRYIIKAGEKHSRLFIPILVTGKNICFKFRIHEDFLVVDTSLVRNFDRLLGISMFGSFHPCELLITRLNGSIMSAMQVTYGIFYENSVRQRMCQLIPNVDNYVAISHYRGSFERYYYSMTIMPGNSSEIHSFQMNSVNSIPIMIPRSPKLCGKYTFKEALNFDIDIITDKDFLREEDLRIHLNQNQNA